MRLRTFESFWLLKNGLLYTYPMLKSDADAEYVVVGGGITGALIAHALMDAGYDTMLVDKRDIALGSTSATTSMLQYEIDTPLYKLMELIGKDAAVRCYRAGINAIDRLTALVKENNLVCGFQSKDSLYVSHDRKSLKWLRQEFEERNNYELGVKWLDENTILVNYGLKCCGGILSEKAASVDAYWMAHELIALNAKRGLRVFDQTIINKINYHRHTAELITDEGHRIRCKKIIFCTGFESVNLLKEKVARLLYTWASISEEGIVLNENLKSTLIWDTDDPYLYMRTTDDGRLLAGGEDSKYRPGDLDMNLKEKKSARLIKKIESIIPGVEYIEDFNWGGVFGTTKDGLPYIGKSKEHEHALFVLGFGGNGITFSVQAMEIIPDLLAGRENELAYYYRFGR